MNTILDQNSGDIREAPSDYPSILEHHSNIIPEDETEEKTLSQVDGTLGKRHYFDQSGTVLRYTV